jgi:hypothetical protein
MSQCKMEPQALGASGVAVCESRPDPVWYVPAAHRLQLLAAVAPADHVSDVRPLMMASYDAWILCKNLSTVNGKRQTLAQVEQHHKSQNAFHLVRPDLILSGRSLPCTDCRQDL